jgi:hypothetical protein
VAVAGEVGRDLTVYGGSSDRVTLEPTAIVHGGMEYTSQEPAAIRDGAVVEGEMRFHQISRESAKAAFAAHAIASLIRLFGLIVVGLVLITLAPKAIEELGEKKNVWTLKGAGWGLVWLVLPPFVALALLFTLIGMPLALILVAVWAVGLYCAQVIVAFTLGKLLLVDVLKSEASHRFFCLAAGAAVWIALVSLPMIGLMIGLAGTILGLGSMVGYFRKK